MTSHSPTRSTLPHDRSGVNHRFTIDGWKCYLRTGEYPNGALGEIFIEIAKEGSTISGLMEVIGVLTSISLQYGVPLKVLTEKFNNLGFVPAGIVTGAPEEFGQGFYAKSLIDYIFRWLDLRYGTKHLPTPTSPAEIRQMAIENFWAGLRTVIDGVADDAGAGALKHSLRDFVLNYASKKA